MPVMAEEFGVSMAAISRLSLVYSIIPSCTLLVFGRMADLFGYKRQFIGGFLVFGLSSLLLPLLATGLAGAVLFRCFQGIGYAMMISITQALCNKTFPASERGKALGINSVFVSIGLALGPSVGGLLISRFSWHSIFFFNIPFCILGVIVSAAILKKEKHAPASLRQMDWLGSLFFAISVGLFTLGINFSAEWGFLSAGFFGCTIIGLISLFLFIRRESRVNMPLMKLTLFRNRTFTCANVASFCSYFLQQMTLFLVPFFLINIMLLSQSNSGFVMLAAPSAMVLLSPIGGSFSDRYGSKRPALAGLCMIALGCVIMSEMADITPLAIVIIGLFLYGVGNSFSVAAINASIFSAVPREESGVASGMVATVRNIGQALGVAFGGTLMAMRQNFYLTHAVHGSSGTLSESGIYMAAQRDTFYFGLLIVAIAVACIILIPGRNIESE